MALQEQEFTLTLQLAEINMILESLGQRPYAEVYGLVQKIQHQAQCQMAAPNATMTQMAAGTRNAEARDD
jgi:hypothetical protein